MTVRLRLSRLTSKVLIDLIGRGLGSLRSFFDSIVLLPYVRPWLHLGCQPLPQEKLFGSIWGISASALLPVVRLRQRP